MTEKEFLVEIQDVLQRDDVLTMDMPLKEIEEWDSLAVMGTAAFLQHHFSVRLAMDDFKQMRVVRDIAAAADLAL
jgi:acyl carrier protein